MLSRHYERLCGWPRALNLLFDCDKDRRLMHIIDTTYWHHEDNSNDNSGGRNSEYHCFCLLRWRAVVRTLRWCWLEPIHRHKKTTISVERIQQATGILEVNNAKDISATTTKNASIDSIFNNDDHNTSFNITMRKSCWWKKTHSYNWWWWWWWWYCWERLWQQCESNRRKSLAKTVAISTYEWTYLALARLIKTINNWNRLDRGTYGSGKPFSEDSLRQELSLFKRPECYWLNLFSPDNLHTLGNDNMKANKPKQPINLLHYLPSNMLEFWTVQAVIRRTTRFLRNDY